MDARLVPVISSSHILPPFFGQLKILLPLIRHAVVVSPIPNTTENTLKTKAVLFFGVVHFYRNVNMSLDLKTYQACVPSHRTECSRGGHPILLQVQTPSQGTT